MGIRRNCRGVRLHRQPVAGEKLLWPAHKEFVREKVPLAQGSWRVSSQFSCSTGIKGPPPRIQACAQGIQSSALTIRCPSLKEKTLKERSFEQGVMHARNSQESQGREGLSAFIRGPLYGSHGIDAIPYSREPFLPFSQHTHLLNVPARKSAPNQAIHLSVGVDARSAPHFTEFLSESSLLFRPQRTNSGPRKRKICYP